MRRVDYDREQYQDYARGRALTEEQSQAWISAWSRPSPRIPARPRLRSPSRCSRSNGP